jgi:hypothetical protein
MKSYCKGRQEARYEIDGDFLFQSEFEQKLNTVKIFDSAGSALSKTLRLRVLAVYKLRI